jgi:hypothetical protein
MHLNTAFLNSIVLNHSTVTRNKENKHLSDFFHLKNIAKIKATEKH